MTKNEKIFLQLKKRYSFLFNNQDLAQLLKNNFDKKGSCIAFVIGLLETKLDKKQVFNFVKINIDEWVELFMNLYKNQTINELFQKLQINPIIPLEQTINNFSCFNGFIESLLMLLKQHQINLNISETQLKEIIKSVYGYLLYNAINWTIPHQLQDILSDSEYEAKYIVTLNNTKLFATAKQTIVDNFGDKINDLIVLLLGINNPLEVH